MKNILFTLIVLFAFGCTDSEAPKFNNLLYGQQIVGDWLMVRIDVHSDNGGELTGTITKNPAILYSFTRDKKMLTYGVSMTEFEYSINDDIVWVNGDQYFMEVISLNDSVMSLKNDNPMNTYSVLQYIRQ